MKIAAFNVENLFDGPRAFNEETDVAQEPVGLVVYGAAERRAVQVSLVVYCQFGQLA